jgi:phosphate:Na+ symporter
LLGEIKDEVNRLVYQALQLQAQRLKSEGADNIDVTMFENELIDSMKRIYSLTKRIAKLTVPDSLIQEAA